MTDKRESIVPRTQQDGVLTLTMNRPDKRNALDLALTEALVGALEEADRDAGVRCVVLTGAGPAFCAGADMKEFAGPERRNSAAANRRSELMDRLFGMIPDMATPVIAAVNGFCLGGGCALMLGCDMAVAADGAVLGYPELKHGFSAGVVVPSLVRLVGTRRAFDLIATARTFDAAEALRLGLVDRVVPAAALADEAGALAAVIAGYAPEAMAETKARLHEMTGLSLSDGLARIRTRQKG